MDITTLELVTSLYTRLYSQGNRFRNPSDTTRGGRGEHSGEGTHAMTQLVQSLVERLSQLPESMQDHLAKRFLQEVEDAEAQTAHQPHKRVAGLGKGTMVIGDDFDDPLPEAFWLGEP